MMQQATAVSLQTQCNHELCATVKTFPFPS